MSSFKDELTAKVNSVRNTIKIEAVNVFIDTLKTAMKNVAARGRKSGSISLRFNFVDFEDCDEDEAEDNNVLELSRLDELLAIEDVERGGITDGDHMRIYKWLLTEVDKTSIFKDIHLNLNIEKFELNFFWD
jgi:fibronectin type 3 domain-containing protein